MFQPNPSSCPPPKRVSFGMGKSASSMRLGHDLIMLSSLSFVVFQMPLRYRQYSCT
jgi:hypothetical protein